MTAVRTNTTLQCQDCGGTGMQFMAAYNDTMECDCVRRPSFLRVVDNEQEIRDWAQRRFEESKDRERLIFGLLFATFTVLWVASACFMIWGYAHG